MGKIKITIALNEGKNGCNIQADNPNFMDLSLAITHLELARVRLLKQAAGHLKEIDGGQN